MRLPASYKSKGKSKFSQKVGKIISFIIVLFQTDIYIIKFNDFENYTHRHEFQQKERSKVLTHSFKIIKQHVGYTQKYFRLSVQCLWYNKFTRHEQVCSIRLRFGRYFSHHQARWWEKYSSKLSLIKDTCSFRNKLTIASGISWGYSLHDGWPLKDYRNL